MPVEVGHPTTPASAAQTGREHLLAAADTLRGAADACAESIGDAAAVIADALSGSGKLLLCGNGGSAADCQHMAAELVSCLTQDFVRPGLAAVALTTDTSCITAYANDFGFDGVFARQVQALGRQGDVLLGISTSGGSRNVQLALEQARRASMRTIALVGADGGACALAADVVISVPAQPTQHVQEAHIAIEHVLCHLVERAVCGPTGAGA